MKSKTTIICYILVVALLAGCAMDKGSAKNDGDDASKLKVLTSVFPPYDFVRQIAGGNVELSMLLRPGSESHAFEPTPQDIIAIQNSDLFIYIGGESETWIEDILASVDTGNTRILKLFDFVEAAQEETVEGMQEDEHEAEGGYDEHIWTSPPNAILLANAIAEAMCDLDAANASAYRANAAYFTEQLEALDEQFLSIVAAAKRKTLVFGDRFPMRYFADRYGLEYFAAFPGCSADTEADASTLKFLIDKINAEQIQVVFYIEFSNQKIADAICESTGAKKLLFHSCHNVSKQEFYDGATYVSLMSQNAQNLREALN